MFNRSGCASEDSGIALLLGAFLSAPAQQISPVDQAIVDVARARYDSLQEKGFVSLACNVHVDMTTVPPDAPCQDPGTWVSQFG